MKLIAIFLLCLFAGCQRASRIEVPGNAAAPKPIATSPEIESPTKAPAEKLESNLPLRFSIQPLPEPHRYRVELDWHGAPAKSKSWTLTREDAELDTLTLTEGPEPVRTWTDNDVTEGKGYRYSLWRNADGELTLHSQVAVRIPIDKVVDGVEELDRIKGIRRLFLTDKARLRPHPNLKIEVEELNAENAVIESFPKDSLASAGDGRSGGSIEIRAMRARGRLTVAARGEQGAVGKNGSSGAAGSNGRPAQNAESDRRYRAPANVQQTTMGLMLCYMFRNCQELNQQELDKFYDIARQKSDPHFDHPVYTSLFECKRNLDLGEDGRPGQNGENGSAGGNGGNTSTVSVEIADSKDFVLKLETDPGQGGRGGNPGSGGPGGIGSPSGKRDSMGICPAISPRDGGDGVRGTDGVAGKDGNAGIVSPHCLRLGGVELGDCASPGA